VKSLTDELASLNKKQISSEQQLERVREEKRKLQEENESLRKEIQLMHVKSKAAEKQEEENLIDRRKYEKFIY
jgi:predicted  nucleic acid-binding Zn-ribbon protein